jgi:hypothetical protein
MAKKMLPPETPCATCAHLHRGNPCFEDGCECRTYVPTEVAPIDFPIDFGPVAEAVEPGESASNMTETPCCSYPFEAGVPGPIYWNPFNNAVTCHNCGETFEAVQSDEDVSSTLPEPPSSTAEISAEDAEKLRAIVAEQNPSKEMPDGSLRTTITVPAEMVEVIQSWAEGAGESFEVYLQRTLDMGLNAVVNGGAVAG